MGIFCTRNFLSILLVSGSLFTTSSNAQVQVNTIIGVSTPSGADKSYERLAHALCDHLPTETAKANAIYNWITHNIKYDVKALQQGKLKEDDPKKVFQQRKGLCGGYSVLFAAMCKEVGISAVTVGGYSKDWMFDDGDKLYIPRHAWNIVYVDQKWQLVDATWGAGYLAQEPGWLKRQLNKTSKKAVTATSGKLKFRFKYDPAYFLSNPLDFRLKHLPSDPVWQLTDSFMPVAVFEAGDQAIIDFNRENPSLEQNSALQRKLSALSEDEQLQVSAERISKYNPRFHVVMAAKYIADAKEAIENSTPATVSGTLVTAKEKIKSAEAEVNKQTKAINAEYISLKSKNKTKNTQATQYMRSLHSNNKRMVNKCEGYLKKADTRITTIKKNRIKLREMGKDVDAGKLNTITTAVKTDPAMMQMLEDSVNRRMERMEVLQESLTAHQAMLSAVQEMNDLRLDTLAGIFTLADSALVEETRSRIRMYDNYDEEVLKWTRLVKTVRLQDVDSIQKRYLSTNDSIGIYYERMRRMQSELATKCHQNLKDIERYKRKGDNAAFLSQYGSQMAQYESYRKACAQTLADHFDYVSRHKELYRQLIKLYNRQDKLVTYMEQSEKKRKELEDKNLKEKEAFDKKENTHQKGQLKQIGQKVEKMKVAMK
ncbi:transglutaminase domain-containing protein [Edaphocola flava]|uniref:transglutaminase domain-containing protein n=1 Tax=Edaphocola flava TaxID=2499629 RepID=UPI00100A9E46|nr:transglutaminase domain-containing protein [Edaphocola flava]